MPNDDDKNKTKPGEQARPAGPAPSPPLSGGPASSPPKSGIAAGPQKPLGPAPPPPLPPQKPLGQALPPPLPPLPRKPTGPAPPPPPNPAFSSQSQAGGAVQGCPVRQPVPKKPCYLQIFQIEEECVGKFKAESPDFPLTNATTKSSSPPKKRVFRVVTELLPNEEQKLEEIRAKRVQLEKDIKDALAKWTKSERDVKAALLRYNDLEKEVAEDVKELDKKRQSLEKAVRKVKGASAELIQAAKAQGQSIMERGKTENISALSNPYEKARAALADSRVKSAKEALDELIAEVDQARTFFDAAKKDLDNKVKKKVDKFKKAVEKAQEDEKKARINVQERLQALVDFEHSELLTLNTHSQGEMPVIEMVSGSKGKWYDNWTLQRAKLNANEPNAKVILTAKEGVLCGTEKGPTGLAHIDLSFNTEEFEKPVLGSMTIPAQDIWQQPISKVIGLAKGNPLEALRWITELATYVFGAMPRNIRDYETSSHACGVKLQNKPPRKPGSALSAKIKVYPADLWEFSIKTPKLMDGKFSASVIKDSKGVTSSASMEISRSGVKVESHGTKLEPGGKITETSKDQATLAREEVESAKDKPLTLTPKTNGWEVKLARNGVEEDIFKGIFKVIEGLAWLINEIPRMINEMQNRVPSWGLKVEFTWSVLNGKFTYGAQWREYIDHRVYLWRKFGIDATIVAINLSLKFGYWLSIPKIFSLEASVGVAANGSLNFATTIEMADPFSARNWDFSATVSAKIGFEGNMTLMATGGPESLGATGALKGGWTFPANLVLNQEGWRFSIGKKFDGLKMEVIVKIPIIGDFTWDFVLIAAEESTVEFFHVPEQKSDSEKEYKAKYAQDQKTFLANRADFSK